MAGQTRGEHLWDTMLRLNLTMLNPGEGTFRRGNTTATVMDLSLVSARVEATWRREPSTWGSDHYLLHIAPTGKPDRRPTLHHVTHWHHFRRCLAEEVLAEGEKLFVGLVRCAKQSTRSCSITKDATTPDLKLLQLRAEQNRAERKAQSSGARTDWTAPPTASAGSAGPSCASAQRPTHAATSEASSSWSSSPVETAAPWPPWSSGGNTATRSTTPDGGWACGCSAGGVRGTTSPQ